MRDGITTTLEVVGLWMIAYSAYLVAPALGIAVGGVALLVIGIAAGRE